jgi:hypothetical protein
MDLAELSKTRYPEHIGSILPGIGSGEFYELVKNLVRMKAGLVSQCPSEGGIAHPPGSVNAGEYQNFSMVREYTS